MKFALALLIAVHFWGARGVHVPCHPVEVTNADSVLPPDPVWGMPYRVSMATYVSDCRILVSRSTETFDRIVAPATYCADVVHEVGHIAGLSHSTSGIMDATGVSLADRPYDCVHYQAFRRRL